MMVLGLIGKTFFASDHLRVTGSRGYEASREGLHGNSPCRS